MPETILEVRVLKCGRFYISLRFKSSQLEPPNSATIVHLGHFSKMINWTPKPRVLALGYSVSGLWRKACLFVIHLPPKGLLFIIFTNLQYELLGYMKSIVWNQEGKQFEITHGGQNIIHSVQHAFMCFLIRIMGMGELSLNCQKRNGVHQPLASIEYTTQCWELLIFQIHFQKQSSILQSHRVNSTKVYLYHFVI